MKVKIHSTNWDEQMTMYGESLNPISHSILPHFLNNQTLPKKNGIKKKRSRVRHQNIEIDIINQVDGDLKQQNSIARRH